MRSLLRNAKKVTQNGVKNKCFWKKTAEKERRRERERSGKVITYKNEPFMTIINDWILFYSISLYPGQSDEKIMYKASLAYKFYIN